MNTMTSHSEVELPRTMWFKFATAGMAHFTVRNPETKQHIAVRITTSKAAPTWRYVRCAGYEVGKLAYNHLSDTWVWIPKPEIAQDPAGNKAAGKFQWFWNNLVSGSLPTGFQVLHMGRCGKCGRDLTDPKSIHMGIGPECRKTMGL